MTLKEAKSLAIKVLSKTMDSTTLGGEKCNYQEMFLLIYRDIKANLVDSLLIEYFFIYYFIYKL